MAIIITSIKVQNPIIQPLSVLILVYLLVSFISVIFHVGYIISLSHLCFIMFLSLYVRIHALMHWSIQLHSSKSV